MSPIDFLPIVAILGVFYFLVLKPQNDERNAHEALLTALAKDDEVVTSGGIHGRVVVVGDTTIVLEITDKTKITIDKNVVARRAVEPASVK